jgi:PhzF family phenazine biosynthesis protein
MAHRCFKQVDVFTRRPFFGNPVGVVLDGSGLDAEAMQRMAAWANISETTFVLPPTTSDADYRVRIFAPRRELPFAGHPTLGTAHAVLEAGIARPRAGRLRQECGAGVLTLSVTGEGADRQIAVEVPPAKVTAVDPAVLARVQAALGLATPPTRDPQVVDLGPRWLMLELADAAAVRALAPDQTALAATSRALGITGVTAFGRARAADHALAVRSFAPAEAIPEDPVCGSGNAAIGVLLDAAGALPGTGPEFVASQGRELGRDGFVTVRVDPATRRTWIGGHSVTCIDGTVPE